MVSCFIQFRGSKKLKCPRGHIFHLPKWDTKTMIDLQRYFGNFFDNWKLKFRPRAPRTKNAHTRIIRVLVLYSVLHTIILKPTPSLDPYTDSIGPTESHKERHLSSRHPDRCLYAVLAFIGYGWSRILCATVIRLRTVVCVPFFRLFCLYLVLSSSDRRPTLPYSHTCTQQQIPTPRVISSLPSVVLPHGITHGSPSPECLWYTYLSVIFFSAACLFDTSTCSCYTRYDIPASQQIKYLLAPPFVM